MKIIIIFSLFLTSILSAQNLEKCNLRICPNTDNIFIINDEKLICLLKNENKTIIYSYAFWCKPCVEELPHIINFANNKKVNLYILLIHNENSREMQIENNKFKNENLNILVLSDEYGNKPRKKYKNFLKKFYAESKLIDDMSKIILFDEDGNLMYISDWTDGDDVLTSKILPLLN